MKRGYAEAQADPEKRQEFLDSIDLEEFSPFIEGVHYGTSDSRKMMGAQYPVDSRNGARTRIEVYDRAFKKLNWEAFYNCLVHHEGFHAKISNSSPAPSWREIFATLGFKIFKMKNRKLTLASYLGEIGAYTNQINHPSFSKCPEDFQRAMKYNLEVYQRWIGIYGDK